MQTKSYIGKWWGTMPIRLLNISPLESPQLVQKVKLSFERAKVFKNSPLQEKLIQLSASSSRSYAAPSKEVIDRARDVLDLFEDLSVTPSSVVPSAEGGIGIVLSGGGVIGEVELLNDGDLFFSVYGQSVPTKIWEGSFDHDSLKENLGTLLAMVPGFTHKFDRKRVQRNEYVTEAVSTKVTSVAYS